MIHIRQDVIEDVIGDMDEATLELKVEEEGKRGSEEEERGKEIEHLPYFSVTKFLGRYVKRCSEEKELEAGGVMDGKIYLSLLFHSLTL